MSGPRPGAVWLAVRDAFRTQLWPLPTSAVVIAVALGVALPQLESAHHAVVPSGLQRYLFSGGADAARSVLETVAGSLMTVTSLTFSLTVVTLQLASSQFSPRLLRTFTRDLVVQGTLGLFLGTFAYALTVLRTVRTSSDTDAEFVPGVSITLAYVLTVASVVALALFLAHLALTIRVESMLRNVHEDATDTLERELGERPGALTPAAPTPSGAPQTLAAAASGFLVRVRERELLKAACEADVVVRIDVRPGDSLVAATPVGAAWPHSASGGHWTGHAEAVRRCLVVGFERTSVQDVSFGLRQLTDVVVKALSPGINDPTTAVHGLSHSAALLCELAVRDLRPRVLTDEQGVVRVVLARPDLAELARLAVDQPARYGAGEPAVLARLIQLLRELAWVGGARHHDVVRGELSRLREVVAAQDFGSDTRAELARHAEELEAALDGVWPSTSAR